MIRYYGYCKVCGSMTTLDSVRELEQGYNESCERCPTGTERFFSTAMERDIYILECKHNVKLNVQVATQ